MWNFAQNFTILTNFSIFDFYFWVKNFDRNFYFFDQNVDFYLNLYFLTKMSIFDQISIFGQNIDLWQKNRFLTKMSIFWPKCRLLTRIPMFDRNVNFWPKFRFFWPKCGFLTKMPIFDRNVNFWPKCQFLTKISIFWPKCGFLTKISIFNKSR